MPSTNPVFSGLNKFSVVEFSRKFRNGGFGATQTFVGLCLSPEDKNSRSSFLCLWGTENISNISTARGRTWAIAPDSPLLADFGVRVLFELEELTDIRDWPLEISGPYIRHTCSSCTDHPVDDSLLYKDVSEYKAQAERNICSRAIAQNTFAIADKADSTSKKRRRRRNRIKSMIARKLFHKVSGLNKRFLYGTSECWTNASVLENFVRPGRPTITDTMKTAVKAAARGVEVIYLLKTAAALERTLHLKGYSVFDDAGVEGDPFHLDLGYLIFIKNGVNLRRRNKNSPRHVGPNVSISSSRVYKNYYQKQNNEVIVNAAAEVAQEPAMPSGYTGRFGSQQKSYVSPTWAGRGQPVIMHSSAPTLQLSSEYQAPPSVDIAGHAYQVEMPIAEETQPVPETEAGSSLDLSTPVSTLRPGRKTVSNVIDSFFSVSNSETQESEASPRPPKKPRPPRTRRARKIAKRKAK